MHAKRTTETAPGKQWPTPARDRSKTGTPKRSKRTTERRRMAAEQAGTLLRAGGFLRLPEVLALIPVSPSTWWEGCRTGRFPQGVKLGIRCTAWSAASIRQLLERIESGEVAA